jgi:hypothetical protein
MSKKWLIDEQGQLWADDSEELRLNLKTRLRGLRLTSWLVRQLGFVAVEQFGARNFVAFDPERVSPVGLTGLAYWIADHSFVPTVWRHPTHQKLSRLFFRLPELMTFVGDTIEARMPLQSFSKRSVALESSVFASRWRGALEVISTVSDDHASNAILNTFFDGHYAMSTQQENGEYKVQTLGDRHYEHDHEFATNAVNRLMRECFDNAYGEWLTDTFNGLASTNKFVFTEEVSANIAFPNIPRRRYTYDRLVLMLPSVCGQKRMFNAIALH